MTLQGFPRTIQRVGIVNVPLYEVPYDPITFGPSTNGFDFLGPYPMIGSGRYNNITGGVDASIGVPGITGIATTTPTTTPAGNIGVYAGYQDGHAVLSYPNAVTGGFAFASIPLTTSPGLQSAPVRISQSSFTVSYGIGITAPGWAFLNKFPLGPMLPCWVNSGGLAPSTPFWGAFWNPSLDLWEYLNLYTLPYDFIYISGANAFFHAHTVFNPIPGGGIKGGNYCLYDNGGDGVARLNRVCFYFETQPFSGGGAALPILYNPTFDDAALQTAWMAGGAGYFITSWTGGFIVNLLTNGAGPTGNRVEIAVVSPDFTQYTLLNLVPQVSSAQVALSRGAPGNWPVKIDPNGILYFNSGNGNDAQKLWYSYSPIPFGFPQFNYTAGTYKLPCYSTCYPFAPEF